MNTLFGNNVVNNHDNKAATNNSQQSSSAQPNYRNDNFSSAVNGTQQNLFNGENSPTSNLEPIDFDSVVDFKSMSYKDGRIDSGDEDWIERKKCTMSEIADKPIVIRSVHERKSKLYDDKNYISINFVNENNEECYVNTSGYTIRKQLSEKNISYPFKATIKSCERRDNPNLKYYKLV